MEAGRIQRAAADKTAHRPLGRRLTALLVSILVLIAAAGSWIARRIGTPERLTDEREAAGITGGLIAHGRLYWVSGSRFADAGNVPLPVLSCPVSGGRPIVVGTEPPATYYDVVPQSKSGSAAHWSAAFCGNSILYVTRQIPGPGEYPANELTNSRSLWRAVNGAKEPVGRPFVSPRAVRIPPALVRSMPLATGQPATVARLDAAGDVALFCSGVFWLQVVPERVRIERSETSVGSAAREPHSRASVGTKLFRIIVSGHCDVMYTKILGGTTGRLATGLPLDTRFEAREDGIFWTAPRRTGADGGLHAVRPAGGAPETDLFYAGADTGAVVKLGGYGRGVTGPSCEYCGRIYWFHAERFGGPGALMSANLDGSGIREEFGKFQTPWSLDTPDLIAARPDGIYGVLSRLDAGGHKMAPTVCRIRPGHTALIDHERMLPPAAANFRLDGDFVYFTAPEESRNAIQAYVENSASGQSVARLYRTALK